jgi:hypothetical protein
MLALVGGAALVGAALVALGSRRSPAARSPGERRVPMQRPEVTAQSTTLHMTPEQAVLDHPDGFLVLNGELLAQRQRSSRTAPFATFGPEAKPMR